MTARDEVLELLAAHMRDLDLPIPTKRAQMLLAAYDAEHRAEVLREAADFVRDAYFRDGLSVQEIGAALRGVADASTPTSGHSCGNCEGVDPDTCLMNRRHVNAVSSKEQQR